MSALAIAAGIAGMFVSFVFLSSASFEDITAGSSGFVAGAILIGAGLVALALLSRRVVPAHGDESGNPAALQAN